MTPTMTPAARPRSFADAEARLAESLPGYESRPQQQRLAQAVESAFGSRRHLIAEAGCGTGKSLGYLIPAILSGQRVIVATATKALQDQIVDKDLPFLAEHLGVDFVYALLKGRSNYFCGHTAQSLDAADVPDLAAMLEEASAPGFTGERESFSFDIPAAEWAKVSSESETCSDLGCFRITSQNEDGSLCFAERARRQARAASVVVVNLALFFTDLAVRNLYGPTFLDNYDAVIFDEAHEAEEYACNTLGSQFSEGTVNGLSAQIRNFIGRHNNGKAPQITTIEDSMAEVAGATKALWAILEAGRIRAADVLKHQDTYVRMSKALQDLANSFSAYSLDTVEADRDEIAKIRVQKQRLMRRAHSTSSRFDEIVVAEFDELVRWVEVENNRRYGQQKVIKTSPITVAPMLRDWLFAPERPVDAEGRPIVNWQPPVVVLTSATMELAGSFNFIAGRLGIDTFDAVNVGTPFDFSKQSVLYVPKHLPDPTPANRTRWSSMAITEIRDLVRASEGRALLLFTSVKDMREAYDTLVDRLPYTAMMQGQKPNKDLAADFMADTHSVLFATKSFFTGVDFQGDTCSLVVISKLPFPVPTEPVFEARTEVIDARGGNSFSELTIPMMTLPLKQGFGRLIRHRNDRGVVAILDPRLLTKGYGKAILRSLPDATRATTLAEVESFFTGEEG